MCIVCASGEAAANAGTSSAVSAAPPSFTLEQIIANLDRNNIGWDGGVVNYSFFTELGSANAGDENYEGFQVFNAAQKAAVASIFTMFSDVANLTFVSQPDNGTSDDRITFANSTTMPDYVWGWASNSYYYPSGTSARDGLGDMEVWVNTDSGIGSYAMGTYNFMALMHEMMHALGVPHPGEYNANADEDITYATHADYAQDSRQFTIMSYFEAEATGAQHGDIYAAAPLLHDISVLQRIYGANTTTRTGDTVYGFNSNAGRDAFDFTKNAAPVIAIWDAGGKDTIDLSGYSTASTIDLREGGFSSFNGLTKNMAIAFGAVVENAIGGSAADTLYGNAAANRLDGRAGADRMEGFGGDDVYVVDNKLDKVIEAKTGGYDEILSSVNLSLAGLYVERLTLTGSSAVYAVGNSLNNALIGNTANNSIDGGTGADAMRGGKGNDTYFVDNAGDRIYELNGEGTDTVKASVSFSLAGQYAENLILTGSAAINATGNSLANTLTGNTGVNVLSGGTGNDTYYVQTIGDRVVEANGAGSDRVFASVSFSLAGSYIEKLYLTGAFALNGTGNSLNNELWGNAGANVLSGGGGYDLIVGGGGRDTLSGGALSDRFVFSSVADTSFAASDRITDLSNDDRIDLRGIDANSGLAGDQAFSLVSAFSRAAGQAVLTFDAGRNETSLLLDVNGDGAADARVLLTGDHRDFDNFLM